MTHDTIPPDNEENTKDMGIRDLLIEQRTDTKWIKQKLQSICKEQKKHDTRINALEYNDARQETRSKTGRDNTALAIAILALIVSTSATIWNIVGGN